MNKDYTKEQLKSLPKWARDKIDELEIENKTLIKSLEASWGENNTSHDGPDYGLIGL